MNDIVLAVLLIGALGLICGLGLAIASVLMAVPRDEKAEALRDLLPGANCGACGYSGCDGYAAAMANEGAKIGLCSPGGAEVAKATGELLGVSGDVQIKTALVRCGGCTDKTACKLTYRGVSSCKAANQFYGGDRKCRFGCLGYGDCEAVCEYHAISIVDGLCRINPALCRGCGKCVKACPKGIIGLFDGSTRGIVRCASHDKGAVVRKACTAGCIGCMKCTKVCTHDAIKVENNLAVIDPQKCVGCGDCAANCPVGCISVFGNN